MDQLNQRQGFLVSSVVHMVILTILWNGRQAPPVAPPPSPEAAPRVSQKVFLPPPSVLRQLRAPTPPPRPVATPVPPPTPPPARPPEAKAKDRISIGPPSEERKKGPIELRREDDLTAVAKGRPDPVPSAAARAPSPSPAGGGREAAEGRPGLRMPPGVDTLTPRGDGGASPRPGPSGPSIASSLRELDARLQSEGALGLPSGTAKQVGALAFDPQGADFTLWVNHFKNEVYRNWIVPQPALLGFGGHVDIEFVVERDGSLSSVRLLKSAGLAALDRAAQNALLGSRLLPLPDDYAPPRVQMQVVFVYPGSGRSS